MGIEINAGKVRGASDDTEALARQAKRKMSHALDASDEVRGQHHGWASAQALHGCSTAWEEHMVALASRMGDLSAKLRESANSMTAADREAESRLQAGLSELGGA